MFAGVNFALAVFVWYCVPETRNVALEEMDVLFGGSNHVQQGENLIGLDGKSSEEDTSVVGSNGAVTHATQGKAG
jgi:hypothetical protein